MPESKGPGPHLSLLELGPGCRWGQAPRQPRRLPPTWFWQVANYLSSPQFPRCSSPWFTRPHSPCVKRRPLHSCVTMALACARLALQEMTPPGLSFLPLWVALATRYVFIWTQGFELLGGRTGLWSPCWAARLCACVHACVCVCVLSKVR